MNADELKVKRTKFLDDTLTHFNAHNRAKDARGVCSYARGCAIGRHLDKELAYELDRADEESTTAVSNYNIFEKLPASMKELGQNFLSKIQHLHDQDWPWVCKSSYGELHEKGETFVKEIREYIENNRND